MAPAVAPSAPPPLRRHRRWIVPVVVAVAVVIALTLAIFVPVGSASVELNVAAGTSPEGELSIPHAGWVTVHFAHAGMMAMRYWMDGPSGMMFDHSMMQGGYDYSFWSWGGTYRCGAEYAPAGVGMAPAWVNATWGYL